MDFYKSVVADHTHGIIASFPQRINYINEFTEKNFSKSLVEAEAEYFKIAQTYVAKSKISSNEELTKIVASTKDIISDAIIALSSINRWIIVNTPRIEDGGNFGVAVQEIVSKGIIEAVKDLTTKLNDVTDYHNKRADAVKSLAAEVSSSESKSSSKGTDKGESKESTSEEKKESTSTKIVHEDTIRNVAAVDAKYYFNAQIAIQAVADAYLLAGFAAEKNHERLERPRGNENSKNPLSMY